MKQNKYRLDAMTYDQLLAERKRFLEEQKGSQSDYSWWGFEVVIDDIDKQLDKIMKLQTEIIVRRFTAKRVIAYVNDLVESETLAEKARKAKEKVQVS